MSRYNSMRSGERIDKVVDSIPGGVQFVYVDSLSGTLDSDTLSLLLMNKVNRLVYANTVYYLSIIDSDYRKFFSRVQSSVYNEIDVNIKTGVYTIISKEDPLLHDHIADTDIHVTAEEKASWNNKVTASVSPIEGTPGAYTLVLSKE